jgi:hypothetical protein
VLTVIILICGEEYHCEKWEEDQDDMSMEEIIKTYSLLDASLIVICSIFAILLEFIIITINGRSPISALVVTSGGVLISLLLISAISMTIHANGVLKWLFSYIIVFIVEMGALEFAKRFISPKLMAFVKKLGSKR